MTASTYRSSARVVGSFLRGAWRTVRLWLPTKYIRSIGAPISDDVPIFVKDVPQDFEAARLALSNLQIDDAVHILQKLVNSDCSESDIGKLQAKREVCLYLAVAMHQGLGRLDEAILWWHESMRLARLIAQTFNVRDPDDFEIYDPFWSNHIGHTAMLGIHAKREILDGKVDLKRYLIRPSEPNPGNRYLVERIGSFFTLVDEYAQIPYPREYIDAVAKYIYVDNRLSGPSAYLWQVLAEVSRAWEESGGGALLSFLPEEMEQMAKRREALGVPRNAWHACLHVRASGFKGHHEDLHAALNAEISSYDLAIDAVVKRGGWVVRMGNSSMPKLPDKRHVIDYAHSPTKSAEMDIFLCGTSRFYVGTSSGLAYVPALYGVPSVLTNWFPTGTRPLNSYDLFIPKLHWYETENELAPFDKSMAQPLGHIHATPQLRRLGISLRPNTREELRDVVLEMLDRLDGKAKYTAEDLHLQACFEKVAVDARSYGNAENRTQFLAPTQELVACHSDCQPVWQVQSKRGLNHETQFIRFHF